MVYKWGNQAHQAHNKQRSFLVLCHEFPPLGGGAGWMTYLLCLELHLRGHHIEIWTNKPAYTQPFPFEVVYLPSLRKVRFSTNFFAMGSFVVQSIWKALRTRPAVDHILSSMAIPAGFAGHWVSKIWRRPHSIWYLGSDVHAGKETGAGGLQQYLLQSLWERTQVNFFASRSLLKMATEKGESPQRLF